MILAQVLVASGLAIGGTVLLLAVIAMMGGGSGGAQPKFRDPPIDGPGTGPINPGSNNQGPKPNIKGPGGTIGWGGGQYGSGPVPGDFDWNGSLPWISEDCKTIAEPLLFLPIPGSHQILFWWMPTGVEDTQDELYVALAFIGPPRDFTVDRPAQGTAWGYIARLVHDVQPYSPELIATEILAQMIEANGAECGDIADTTTWSKAMKSFFDSLVDRIRYGVKAVHDTGYVWYDEESGIEFNP